MNKKKYTEADVSDELAEMIEVELSSESSEGECLPTKTLIAEAWYHYPDRLTWRWEGNEIYIGLKKVAKYHINISFRPINLITGVSYESLLSEPEARLACERIADDFIKQLTAK